MSEHSNTDRSQETVSYEHSQNRAPTIDEFLDSYTDNVAMTVDHMVYRTWVLDQVKSGLKADRMFQTLWLQFGLDDDPEQSLATPANIKLMAQHLRTQMTIPVPENLVGHAVSDISGNSYEHPAFAILEFINYYTAYYYQPNAGVWAAIRAKVPVKHIEPLVALASAFLGLILQLQQLQVAIPLQGILFGIAALVGALVVMNLTSE